MCLPNPCITCQNSVGRYLINAFRVAVVVRTERRFGRVILVASRCLRDKH